MDFIPCIFYYVIFVFISSTLYSVSVLGRTMLVLYNVGRLIIINYILFFTYFSSLQKCTCILIFTVEVYGERNYTGINVITDKIISTKLNNNNYIVVIIIIIIIIIIKVQLLIHSTSNRQKS